jgi:hypothetical protein
LTVLYDHRDRDGVDDDVVDVQVRLLRAGDLVPIRRGRQTQRRPVAACDGSSVRQIKARVPRSDVDGEEDLIDGLA